MKNPELGRYGNISVKTYLWWGLWVAIGRLLFLIRRLDDWVRSHYADALTQEVIRRGLTKPIQSRE